MAAKLAAGGATEKNESKSAERVEEEAEAGGFGGHKRGGRAKKAAGGPVAPKLQTGGAVQALKRGGKVHHGSMPMHVDGKAPRHHRMDRAPGRKRGGGVGADTSPMTAASRLTAPKGVHDQHGTDARDD